jgi:hypothetical protein
MDRMNFRVWGQGSFYCCALLIKSLCLEQEADLIRLKREAKLKGGFYVEPEAKLMFVIRIRG